MIARCLERLTEDALVCLGAKRIEVAKLDHDLAQLVVIVCGVVKETHSGIQIRALSRAMMSAITSCFVEIGASSQNCQNVTSTAVC